MRRLRDVDDVRREARPPALPNGRATRTPWAIPMRPLSVPETSGSSVPLTTAFPGVFDSVPPTAEAAPPRPERR
jgi:hypothetical protein